MTLTADARFRVVDPAGTDAMACLGAYYRELSERFEEGFDIAKSISSTGPDFSPPRGSFLVLYIDGEPVGCGGVTLTAPDVGYIKRMWIATPYRGRGLGRELLGALENTAGELGCTTVQLETNRSLSGAIALYRGSGYREVPPFNDEYYAHHWFEKQLG